MNEFWSWFESYVVPKLSNSIKKTERINGFRFIFNYLDQFKNPIILETGCSDIVDDTQWQGSGYSTVLFDKYVSLNGGTFHSCDIDQRRVENLRNVVSGRTHIHKCDGVEFLDLIGGPPPILVYLDSWDLDWHLETESQVHHYNEMRAIYPKLNEKSLVVVDDSPAIIDEQFGYEIRGKGGLVGKFANELGVPLVFSEYQSAWLGFPGQRKDDEESNEKIIFKAREFLEEGKWERAYPLYKGLLARTYDFHKSGRQRIIHGEACAFFARLALRGERHGHAYDWYKRALKADPRANEYRLELVNKVLVPMANYVNAKTEAKRAVRIDPTDVDAWRTLGNVESSLDNAEESIKAHRKQVEVSGNSSIALFDLSTVLIDVEKYDEAEVICKELISRDGKGVRNDAYHIWAMIEARKGNHEGAIELYEKAKEGEPPERASLVDFHISLSLQSIGRYKEGFAKLAGRINNRSNSALFVPMHRFKKPLFEMQAPPAVVHVHNESGDGDNLCFMRYLPMLAEKGYTVRYEVRSNLYKVMTDSLKSKGVEVVPEALDFPGTLGLKDFDYHLPVGELAYQFETDIDTVPWYGPYIKADPDQVEKYKHCKGKIGICWSSGIREGQGIWIRRYGLKKSPGFDVISNFIYGVGPEHYKDFVSLQAGPPKYENRDLIANVLPEDPLWYDTAALIENLDLVITCDTAVAHIAGGMGKETWLMMHGYNSGWHFMCERPGASWNERSPWYPNTRVFRQNTPGDWYSVVSLIEAELRQRFQKAA